MTMAKDAHDTFQLREGARWRMLSTWVETHPWNCHMSERICGHSDHALYPMAGDLCAACDRPLEVNKTCYATNELPTAPNGRLPWVCHRHVRGGMR